MRPQDVPQQPLVVPFGVGVHQTLERAVLVQLVPVLHQLSPDLEAPEPAPVTLVAPLSFRVAGVLPDAADPSELDRFVTHLAEACAGRSIVLTGHTCDLGNEQRNLVLGHERASHVRGLLLAAGVREPVEVQTAGSGRPLESNATEAGRQHNRRVTATCSEEVK